jgi:hypothetical protein
VRETPDVNTNAIYLLKSRGYAYLRYTAGHEKWTAENRATKALPYSGAL